MFIQSQPTAFAGVDWGSQSHQVCVLGSDGAVLGEKAFPHSGEGLGQLLDWILDCAACEANQVAVAIEIPHGPVVDSLLDRGFQVFSINPKQLDRFRDRFSPAGAKDDRRDARVLAGAVRTDPDCLRALSPLDADIVKLREWSRMADELTAERTGLTNRFREQLWRYYPQFLELGADLSSPWALALWKLASTPEDARRVRPSSVAKLLKKHRIRRFKAEEVIQTLRAEPVTAAPGVVEAATLHIRVLAEKLAAREAYERREARHGRPRRSTLRQRRAHRREAPYVARRCDPLVTARRRARGLGHTALGGIRPPALPGLPGPALPVRRRTGHPAIRQGTARRAPPGLPAPPGKRPLSLEQGGHPARSHQPGQVLRLARPHARPRPTPTSPFYDSNSIGRHILHI